MTPHMLYGRTLREQPRRAVLRIHIKPGGSGRERLAADAHKDVYFIEDLEAADMLVHVPGLDCSDRFVRRKRSFGLRSLPHPQCRTLLQAARQAVGASSALRPLLHLP